MTSPGAGIRIGIDTGGTFTDVVVLDEATGQLATAKTPSTPADPALGFATAVRKALQLAAADGGTVTAVSHGTTVATNQLLEDRIGPLGFITTEGFEFILEIARQSVPDGYGNSYFWVKPPRIVPAHLVRTVGGRLDHTGREIRPFDEPGAIRAARFFAERGVNTVGVCFLHAYANPGHERRMRDVLAAEHPGCVVSISSDVLREYREYERSVTTLVDAAVKPGLTRYINSAQASLDAITRPRLPFYMMKSNGGVLSAEEVMHQPVTTVLSGPAAGALGAALVARHAGYTSVITLDGGGTSTDVSVVVNGEPTLTTEGTIGRYTSKIPMIDVATVGAGGGSIAGISPEGTLKVGPRSAGADPGPLCYAKGGTDVTVTDAHVTLGRIPPHLLGGEIPLDVAAAREGVVKLAADLGLGFEACAAGILELSAWNQANAVRQITVGRGLDIRDFTMVTFGGSGSLLACRLMDILGLETVVVPRNPGNVSAFGLLTVDVKNDYVQTFVTRHTVLDIAAVRAAYAGLARRATRALDREGFGRGDHRLVRTADLRYYGQASEVQVAAPAGDIGERWAQQVADAFHDAHAARYGYHFRGDDRQQVEWVNLRVTGIGPMRRPLLPEIPAGDGDPQQACTGTRPVFFDGWAASPIYRRPGLRAGDRVSGPAVIEEFGATIPVHPGFTATADRAGNLVLARETR